MKSFREKLTLYAVTDRGSLGDFTLYEKVEAAIKGGITCLQLREKNMGYDEFLAEANKFKKLCEKNGVTFIINDNVDIALKCNADGVHVGQSDMDVRSVRALVGDKMIIGVTAKTVEQAISAEKGGADYLGVGAVFGTSTKSDATEITTDRLREIANSVSIPVVAIGGICKDNIMQLYGCGISGVAVASAIFSSTNPERTCQKLYDLAKKYVK